MNQNKSKINGNLKNTSIQSGSSKKQLIVVGITIGAILLLLVLVMFGKQFVGKAFEVTTPLGTLSEGEMGLNPIAATALAGDEFSVTISANVGQAKAGSSVKTTLNYDFNQLEHIKTESILTNSLKWLPENLFIITSDQGKIKLSHSAGLQGTTYITGSANLFKVTFKIKSTLKGGEQIILTLTNSGLKDEATGSNLIISEKSSTITIKSAGGAPPVCTPSCSGKTCGDDGCGGSCGSCAAGESCSNGACLQAAGSGLLLNVGEIGIDPVSGTVNPGDTFQVAIKANLGTKSANSVETTLAYNKNKLEVIGVDSLLKTSYSWPEGSLLSINKDIAGGLSYKNVMGLVSKSAKKITGTVNLFKVSFKVKADVKTGASTISLKNTIILDGQKNLITSSKTSVLTIAGVACTPSCVGKTCGDDGCGGSCGSCVAGTKCQDNVCKNQAAYLCSDTDNGKNYIIKGTVYSYNLPDGKDDECDLTTGKLKEKYCLKNEIGTLIYTCPSGFKCDTGACVPSTSEVCDNEKDDDGDNLINCDDPDCNVNQICASFCDSCSEDCTQINGLWTCVGCTSDDSCINNPAYGTGFKCINNICKSGEDFCTETDEGKNIYKKGTVNSNKYPEGKIDSCDAATNMITEYYCDQNQFTTYTGLCPSGFKCEGGACICTLSCTDKTCGDDGCGGSCGSCAAGEKCESNKCVSEVVGVSGDYTSDQTLNADDIFVLQLAIESAQPQNSGCGASGQDSCSLGGVYICENGKYSESSMFVCSNEIPLDLTGDGKLDENDIFVLQLAIEASQPQNVNCGASSQDSCSLGGIYICENAKYSETSSFKC